MTNFNQELKWKYINQFMYGSVEKVEGIISSGSIDDLKTELNSTGTLDYAKDRFDWHEEVAEESGDDIDALHEASWDAVYSFASDLVYDQFNNLKELAISSNCCEEDIKVIKNISNEDIVELIESAAKGIENRLGDDIVDIISELLNERATQKT